MHFARAWICFDIIRLWLGGWHANVGGKWNRNELNWKQSQLQMWGNSGNGELWDCQPAGSFAIAIYASAWQSHRVIHNSWPAAGIPLQSFPGYKHWLRRGLGGVGAGAGEFESFCLNNKYHNFKGCQKSLLIYVCHFRATSNSCLENQHK